MFLIQSKTSRSYKSEQVQFHKCHDITDFSCKNQCLNSLAIIPATCCFTYKKEKTIHQILTKFILHFTCTTNMEPFNSDKK